MELEALEVTGCPLCGSQKQEEAYDFSPFTVVQCTTCGFYYLSPRLHEVAMIEVYKNEGYFSEASEGGYDNYAVEEIALRATFANFLKQLKRKKLVGGSLLEIGSGYGYFLKEARPYFARRCGTEYSESAAEVARSFADDIYIGGVSSIPEQTLFDCIVAVNVLEHVYDPIGFLQSLKAYLNPGGAVVIAVPNMNSFLRFLMGRRWPSFKTPEHVSYFSEKTLKMALSQAGLNQITTFPMLHAFSLPLIASKFGFHLPYFFRRMVLWIPSTMIASYGYRKM